MPALTATAGPAGERGTLRRKAFCHTFVVLGADGRDRFVDIVRVLLRVKPQAPRFVAMLRVFDPQLPRRLAMDLDVALEWPRPGVSLPLDLHLGVPGLVIPAGHHLVVDLMADTDLEIEFGDGSGSRVAWRDGDARRIGHEFALAQLRMLWPAYLRRVNQNRFLRPGEVKEQSPVYVGLSRAERYDPENQRVKAWFHWSRLRPWPRHDFSGLDRQPGPRWAVYMREAVRSMQAVIHWWLDHRANPDGYLVGGGNQWNDITKLYNKYLCLGALAGDTRLVDAIERYLDAHWNSGRMVRGYAYFLTDITHSAEEASFIQPALHVLRPGRPRHVYRDLLTAGNLREWLGVNKRGHTHFRSNYFNAKRIELKGKFGRDLAQCETAVIPGRTVWWYSAHPALAKLLTAYSDSWLADTLRREGKKPAGSIPSSVQFDTDKLHTHYAGWALMADQFVAAYQLTGDAKYLEPLRRLARGHKGFYGVHWARRFSLSLVGWRTVTGEASCDAKLREFAAPAYEAVRGDAFFQRGIEAGEGLLLLRWVADHAEPDLMEMLRYVIRSNRRSFPIYTDTDPPTDRVYPWGRAVLPTVMLGGRLFDGRAADPLPSAAFAWDDIDTDVVSLVFSRQPRAVRFLVHNFRQHPVEAGLRVLQLPEGRYRLSTALDADSDRTPDSPPSVRSVEMRRFDATRLTLPAGRTVWVELACVSERTRKPRPDLAVTLALAVAAGEPVTARVHNLGAATARGARVRLVDARDADRRQHLDHKGRELVRGDASGCLAHPVPPLAHVQAAVDIEHEARHIVSQR